jgi:F420H(2)-dependent quinone reductase
VNTAARAIRLLSRPRPIVTRLTRLHAALLHASRGRVRRSILFAGGQPVLGLHTVGRRSGRERSTAVAYLRDGGRYAVIGGNLGSTRDPAWCLNLEAEPNAWIDVDGKRLPVRSRRAAGQEAERLWAAYARRLPAVEPFREIAGREIPIFVLEVTGPPLGSAAA